MHRLATDGDSAAGSRQFTHFRKQNMARLIVTFVIGAIVGIAGGLAAGIFLYPQYFPAETMAAGNGQSMIATGRALASGDFKESGTGKLQVYRELLVLDADFQVNPGPDYRVYLVPARDVTPLTNVEKTMYVDLGPLQAFKGTQRYAIPAGVDLADYTTAVIWSRHFGTLITAAALKP